MNAALKQDLVSLRVDIETAIEVLRDRAKSQFMSIFELQTPDGHSPLTPLLQAKASVLAGLASLEK